MGKAWDAAREYTSTIQLPLLRLYIECLKFHSEACKKYSSAAEKLPSFEKLDEEIIAKARDRYDKAWDREFMRNHPRQTVLNYYEKKIARCDKLFDYIYTFIDETLGIFSEIEENARFYCNADLGLKQFGLDEKNFNVFGPSNPEELAKINALRDSIGKYYADIKQKELDSRQKELEEIYKNYGAKAAIENILNYSDEKRLYTEMEIADYMKLAEILSESRGEEYLNLINIVVKECYSYEKTMYNHENDVDSVHFVYKKNEKMGKVLLGVEGVLNKTDQEAANTKGENTELANKRLDL